MRIRMMVRESGEYVTLDVPNDRISRCSNPVGCVDCCGYIDGQCGRYSMTGGICLSENNKNLFWGKYVVVDITNEIKLPQLEER